MNTPNPDKPRFVIVPHRPHARVVLVVLGLLWVGSVIAAWISATRLAAPGLAHVEQELAITARRADHAEDLVAQLKQNVATLRRSDQISRSANTELQASLAE